MQYGVLILPPELVSNLVDHHAPQTADPHRMGPLSGCRTPQRPKQGFCRCLIHQSRTLLQKLLEDAYYHDWQADPFARGAYSYVCVGGEGAEQELGRPIANTLFFAGEATDVTGHIGTVHGAIASGHRAAGEIRSLGP